MTTITRKTAALLYAHDFKLVDKAGNEFHLKSLHKDCFTTERDGKDIYVKYIAFSSIGTDYFVLCRPLSDLTKQIEPGVVPIVELAKIESEPFKITEIIDVNQNTFKDILWVDYYDNEGDKFRFCYCIDSFQKGHLEPQNHWYVKHQQHLFDKLYSFHFRPSQLPEQFCKYIEV